MLFAAWLMWRYITERQSGVGGIPTIHSGSRRSYIRPKSGYPDRLSAILLPVGYFRDSTAQRPLPFTFFVIHYFSVFRGLWVTNCLTLLLNCITHASCLGGRCFTCWVVDRPSSVRFVVHYEKFNLKFTIYQAVNFRRERRGVALLFL
jgi:hypothetical protein